MKIEIQGMKDGEREFSLQADAAELEGLPEEYAGKISAEGKIRKFGKRFTVIGSANCSANLICDRSLEEYSELITVEISLSYIIDGAAAKQLKDVEFGEAIPIREEDKTIDLSGEIRQILTLGLPMKRVAPEYRDKELEEIFPEINIEDDSAESSEVSDDRWSALRNLKLN